MEAYRNLYRYVGLALLLFFLSGCELLSLAGNTSLPRLDCSGERIVSLSQNANGDVSISWQSVNPSIRVRLAYSFVIFETYYYAAPTTSANFHINWASHQGSGDEISVNLVTSNPLADNECVYLGTLRRPVPPTAVASMNCANLRLTSPLGGMANGMQTFYWDALQNAVSYRINIYYAGGYLTGWDAGNVTNLSVNVSTAAIGGETPLTVELIATDAGGHTCSQRYEIAREAAPPQAQAPTPTPCTLPTGC